MHTCKAVQEEKAFVKRAKAGSESVTVDGMSLWDLLKESTLWTMKAYVEKNKQYKAGSTVEEEKEEYLVRGNITDQGVLKFFMKNDESMGPEQMMSFMDQIKDENKVLTTIPFSSSRKKASIIVRQADQTGTDKEVRVYTKGGPDFMLRDGLVKRMLCQDGSIADLSDSAANWPKEISGDTHEDQI